MKNTTQKNKKLPKILVGCPTFEGKNYCFKEWIENIREFTYSNFEIFLADNSDTVENSKMYQEKYGVNCKWITNQSNKGSHTKRITDGHNAVRKYFLDNDFDFLLHLESDIFPPKDIINRLLAHNKQVVGATYYLYDDDERQLMVRILDNDYVKETALIHGDNIEEELNGELHSVWSVGLGCTLIHKSVVEKVKFRNEISHRYKTLLFCDTTWAKDVRDKGIFVYWDSSVCCKHLNKGWIEYGDKFMNKL